jgi:Ca2+-binding EF-hand superfamily protein
MLSLRGVESTFKKFDLDKNKIVDAKELEVGLQSYGLNLNAEQIAVLINYFDKDNSKTIDFFEFRNAIRVSYNLLLISFKGLIIRITSSIDKKFL